MTSPAAARAVLPLLLAARFVADSLARGAPPHGAAANHESRLLARKAGCGRPREYRAAWGTG